METVDCLVIGAGVVGLAVARALALTGREVLVAEAEPTFGTGTSSRNSEVIHAGIYYPTGSLKAQLCVAGKQMLYRYCEERHVPHRRCGKLIVASHEDERAVLRRIEAQAIANGVNDLVWLEPAAIAELEPELEVAAALLSPSTGIIDSHALMLLLQGDAENAGATFAFGAPVEAGSVGDEGTTVVFGGEQQFELSARTVINAAGLSAHHVARAVSGVPAGTIPNVSYAKGNYFSLGRRANFNHLIYPVPEPGGLGVHLTLDMGGGIKFGPDVEPVDEIEYEVSPNRGAPFYAAVRKYWPGLGDDELLPAYSGIRPKTNGLAFGDFDFCDPLDGRFISLFGIESPGLTSSLAIGDHVVAMVRS